MIQPATVESAIASADIATPNETIKLGTTLRSARIALTFAIVIRPTITTSTTIPITSAAVPVTIVPPRPEGHVTRRSITQNIGHTEIMAVRIGRRITAGGAVGLGLSAGPRPAAIEKMINAKPNPINPAIAAVV